MAWFDSGDQPSARKRLPDLSDPEVFQEYLQNVQAAALYDTGAAPPSLERLTQFCSLAAATVGLPRNWNRPENGRPDRYFIEIKSPLYQLVTVRILIPSAPSGAPRPPQAARPRRQARARIPLRYCFILTSSLSPRQLGGHGAGVADLLPDGGLFPEAARGDGQPGEQEQPVGGQALPQAAVPLALQGKPGPRSPPPPPPDL